MKTILVTSATDVGSQPGRKRRLAEWAAGEGRGSVRARIVLACSEPGVVYARLAEQLGVIAMTVHNVHRRFTASRLAGLADRPRSGRPKAGLVLTDSERDQLQRWARRAKSTQALALALRSNIILACADAARFRPEAGFTVWVHPLHAPRLS